LAKASAGVNTLAEAFLIEHTPQKRKEFLGALGGFAIQVLSLCRRKFTS
jgi:hypothetical protein